MKWPLLSTTAVSTVTVIASVLNVGTSDGRSPSLALPNFEGILGFSASAGAAAPGPVGFCGRAVVVLLSLFGPCLPAGGLLSTPPIPTPPHISAAGNAQALLPQL